VALAAASRASLLPVVATVVVAWLVAGALARREARSTTRAWTGVAASILVPLLVVGPWYLRNQRLYGSITGEGHLLERFHRSPNQSVIDRVTSAGSWRDLVVAMWTRAQDHVQWTGALWVVGLIAGLAVVVGVRRWVRAGRPSTVRGVAAWAAVVGASVALVAGTFSFSAEGGTLHIRYLVPVVPGLAVAVALGLAARRGRALALTGAVVLFAVVQAVLLQRWERLLGITRLGIGVPTEPWSTAASWGLLGAWAAAMAAVVALLLWDPAAPDVQRLVAATSEPENGPAADHQR
jgi:hypothetical protein